MLYHEYWFYDIYERYWREGTPIVYVFEVIKEEGENKEGEKEGEEEYE